jgi:cytochrome c
MKKILTSVFVILFAIGYVSSVSGSGSADEAKALVEKAAAYLKANGKEKAIAEIGKPKGLFDKGELYAFAYDMTATILALPTNPKLVGKNMYDIPDADGKYYRREVVQIAKAKGSGWVDYKYLNPVSKKIEAKTTYVLKVDDVIIAAGAYK